MPGEEVEPAKAGDAEEADRGVDASTEQEESNIKAQKQRSDADDQKALDQALEAVANPGSPIPEPDTQARDFYEAIIGGKKSYYEKALDAVNKLFGKDDQISDDVIPTDGSKITDPQKDNIKEILNKVIDKARATRSGKDVDPKDDAARQKDLKEMLKAAQERAAAAKDPIDKWRLARYAAALAALLAGGAIGYEVVHNHALDMSGCFVNKTAVLSSTKVCKKAKGISQYCNCADTGDDQPPGSLKDNGCSGGDITVESAQAYTCPDGYEYDYKVVTDSDALADMFNGIIKAILGDVENLFMKFLKDLFNGPLKYLMYGLIALIAIVILIKVLGFFKKSKGNGNHQ
jgi:hypothetical protein